jgi:hypothetical protein
MHTKIIEASNGPQNYGKFMLARMDTEWTVPSALPGYEGRPVVADRGWAYEHLWVLDLQTGEGAIFKPGGLARADLEKHRVWVCPLFEPFLTWLYTQPLDDLDALPAHVNLPDAPFLMSGHRRPGPALATDSRDRRSTMREGRKYRFRYQIPGIHRVPRQGLALFLGANQDALGRTIYVFSGRPEFGTTEIAAEHLSEKVEVPSDSICYMDRRLPRDKREVAR